MKQHQKTNRRGAGKRAFTACTALVLAAAMLLCGCGTPKGAQRSEAPAGLLDDYYAAVNAKVLAAHSTEGDNGSWNWFWDLTEKSEAEQAQIIRTAAAGAAKSGGSPKASDMSAYRIGKLCAMASDSGARNSSGAADFNALMQPVMAAKSVQALLDALGALQYRYGFDSLINTDVYLPDDAPGTNTVRIRTLNYILLVDDYVAAGDSADEMKPVFTGSLRSLMKAAGRDVSAGDMENIYSFLKAAASASSEGKKAAAQNAESSTAAAGTAQKGQSTDVIKKPADLLTEKALTVSELGNRYSNIDVTEYLGTIFKTVPETVRVEDDAGLGDINAYLTEQNLPMLKNYVYLANLVKFAPYFSSDISAAYQTVQKDCGVEDGDAAGTGGEKMTSAEKQVAALLKWDLAKLYSERNFDTAKKERVGKMVNEILAQYKTMLQTEDWLSEETRGKAIAKLEKMQLRIGAPDDIARYLSAWTPDESRSYFANVLAITEDTSTKKYDAAGQAADRTRWQLLPQDCSPCYYPTDNSINIPVAVMFAPYFAVGQTDEQNLGALGTIVGHEITHAFDDLGHQYDQNGDFRNWWSKADETAFEQRAQKVADYYTNYRTPGIMQQDGVYTLGENIADLGAVHCLTEIVRQRGLSADKFFAAYANSWASVSNAMSDALVSGMDEHASDKVRVNAVLASNPLFYETYQIKSGDGMYLSPEKRVELW